jgi:hypothetical protein
MCWLLKRWWFWTWTGFMLVAVCAGYLVIPVGEGGISQASCDRIQLGQDAMETTLFLVHGDKDGRHAMMMEQLDENLESAITLTSFDYLGNQIVLRCDGKSKIIEKNFIPSQLSFLEQAKRRIERRIRALCP